MNENKLIFHCDTIVEDYFEIIMYNHFNLVISIEVHISELDNNHIIDFSSQSARKFATAILSLCDKIESKQ